MVCGLRHKRPVPKMVLPFPTTSEDGHRFSSDSRGMAPRDGYNGLFTTGLLPRVDPSPTLSSFPSPPHASFRGPFHPSPDKSTSPNYSPSPRKAGSHLHPPSAFSSSPSKTPTRRRRSSLTHTSNTASPRVIKSSGLDNGVEKALDSVMRSLKIAMGTPKAPLSTEYQQSRWSSSSDETAGVTEEGEDSGFWKSRKSGESTGSRATMKSVATGKSKVSVKNKKSRRSEDTDRMEVDGGEVVPPVPALAPLTPGRSRRMMNEMVRKLGLTPKKNKASRGPGEATFPTIPISVPPLPVPTERTIPRKSSLSTLRSALTKKSSSQTLRSVRSVAPSSATHPFLNDGTVIDCDTPVPPLPSPLPANYSWKTDEHEVGCSAMPNTPGRRPRTPKTSIGHPRLQPSTSPSTFIRDLPRRAPGTPKQDDEDEMKVPPVPRSVTGDIVFETFVSTPTSLTPASPFIDTPSEDEMDAAEIITFTPPLTARAAISQLDISLRPKRLLNLLPRQQRLNLCLQNPSAAGLRTKKSTDNISAMISRNGLPGQTPLQAKSTNLPNPKSSPFILPTKFNSKRDEMSILGRAKANTPNPNDENENLTFRSGAGDGWDIPAIRSSPYLGYINQPISHTSQNSTPSNVNNTFGAKTPSPPNPLFSSTGSRRVPVPDFTASPVKSKRGSEVLDKMGKDTVDVDASKGVVSLRARKASDVSMRSFVSTREGSDDGLPKEEWELEAYLKELERVDRERAEEGIAR